VTVEQQVTDRPLGFPAAPAVGESRSLVVVQDLKRVQLVMYAGASGDFNPLHTDEVFSTEIAKYPGVFAHGMLSMGLTGRVLTDWFGVEHLVRFGVRFRAQVWPGDTLTATATVESVQDTGSGRIATLLLSTVNQDGGEVVSGTAAVRVAG
jgi:acyl dehydratase